ncbi:hypothetical protein I2486_11795 [Cellulophaga sp. E16_2]|uniref:hypothetical protein n=1 Tax=Cellulophaga sp. E16_2 TaxID=2789297 RepID=UPI001A931FF7|nr:hypothetical protein [Cellulophaga sp. E16_2]MBO0592090.1 hypothetical protein [Cellulophaga sp. E16_2]
MIKTSRNLKKSLVFAKISNQSIPNDEYKQNSDGSFVKISDLGGEEVNFFHYTVGENAGKTKITDGLNSNWMRSSQYVLGYTKRNNKTKYSDITSEYIHGNGPEKSVFYGIDHPMNNNLSKSFVAFKARETYLKEGEAKVRGDVNFGLAGILRSNINMTEQMVGSANFSIYPLGKDEVLIAIFDSKSRYSLFYHLPWVDNTPRLKFNKLYLEHTKTCNLCSISQPYTTTRQTYMWIESLETLKKNYKLYDSIYDSSY